MITVQSNNSMRIVELLNIIDFVWSLNESNKSIFQCLTIMFHLIQHLIMIFEEKNFKKNKNKKINKNSNHYKWIICPSLPHFNAVVVENSLQCDDNDNLFNAHELDSKQPFNNNNNNNK